MSLEVTDVVGPIVAILAASATAASLAGALRAGVLKKVRFGAFEIETNSPEVQAFREALEHAGGRGKEAIPFEIEQLANYYAQILSQSKVSFWFSLIFASLGFLVIVVAAFLYKDGASSSAIAQFIAGIIMDAVSGLFFVQSRNAQQSMGEFFDKLRRDRAQVESRALCDAVVSADAKDALRVHLALYYAGVEAHESVAKAISDTCLRKVV